VTGGDAPGSGGRKFMVTALVPLVAVTIDALARRHAVR
jgi:hypothetical protein